MAAGAAITVGLLGLAGLGGTTTGAGASGAGGGAVGAALIKPGAGATTGLGIGAVTGLVGAGTAAGCAGLLTRGEVGGIWVGAVPDGFGSAAEEAFAPAVSWGVSNEAPQYLQNDAETSHAARQRGQATEPEAGDFPLAGGLAAASATGGGGGSSALGAVPMASIGMGAMAGADGTDGVDGVDEASPSTCPSTWPHVMQKREPGRFCAPQLGHASSAGAAEPVEPEEGSRGGPNWNSGTEGLRFGRS
ncbi:hypothetical protein LVJ94_16750 [Pendulispora rubella]|uniref:Uncharacterized protein n=1 Tax=Pendulispora rubella TaxID=2741070 RepID=A0ABZ2LES4_9BACT